MSELSLPKEVNYAAPLATLPPDSVSTLMSIQSTNGISFSNGQVIQFDLPSQQGLYIIPNSVFIRYKVSYTSGATAGVIRRKPVYTNFTRLEEFIGSQQVSSVYQWNLCANSFIDTNYSFADVYGQQASWGVPDSSTFLDVDGLVLPVSATTDYYLSGPLVCSALSELSHYYPTGLSAPWRVNLTVGSLSEISVSSTNMTAITITAPELCFQVVNLGVGVDNLVASMAPSLKIKTTAWASATQGVAASTSGLVTLPYNMRYQSIENLYFHATTSDVAKGVNGWGDAFNMLGSSTGSGSFQLLVGQQTIPALPIQNTANGGRASVLQYLRMCNSGNLQDQRNTMCIANNNFAQYANGATASTYDAPAKFIIGLPCNRIVPNNPYSLTSLMSGLNAAQTSIIAQIQIGSSTNSAMNCYLVCQYSEIIEIIPSLRQVNVIA
jgi:hypothetical protein